MHQVKFHDNKKRINWNKKKSISFVEQPFSLYMNNEN